MISFRPWNKTERKALQADYSEADKNVMWILLGHAFIAIFVTSSYYDRYWLGIVGSITIMSLSTIAYILLRGTLWFRLIVGVSIMMFTAIFVQQHLGRIEMHFHVFIGLAILTIYKDTLPMIMGSATIIAHHFLFNWFQTQHLFIGHYPVMIFNYGYGLEYVYLHAVMVIAEAIVLGFIIQNSTQQFINSIKAQAALDLSNEKLYEFNLTLEAEVLSRTKELENALQKHIELAEDLKIAKEEADSANRLKSEFLANMSHEIRTPLNSVIGFSDLLENEIKEPKQIGYLHAIKNGGRTLLSLINDILDLSKIEAGHMKIELHPIHIHPFIRDIMGLFTEIGKNKGLNVTYKIDKNVPESLILDEMHIRQILINFVSNALKFTSEGSVHVRVCAEDASRPESINLTFGVKDTGIGISDKNKIKIFDAFVQNDGQDSRKYGGTGLGLSIAKKLALMMGGEMLVTSEFGQGSEFVLKLFDVERSTAFFIDNEGVFHSDTIVFSPAKILIVDDILENRLLLRAFLNEFDFEMDEAEDGIGAIEYLTSNAYDLVLMDIRMPNRDGWETMEIIAREWKDRKYAVVAVTASVMKHDYSRILDVFDGLLEKPLNKHSLLSTLEQFLPHTIHLSTIAESESASHFVSLSQEQITALHHSLSGYDLKALGALESGDIEVAAAFAETITHIGLEYGVKEILDYGRLLKEGCESFDIEMVEKLLKSYTHYQTKWGVE